VARDVRTKRKEEATFRNVDMACKSGSSILGSILGERRGNRRGEVSAKKLVLGFKSGSEGRESGDL